MRTRWIIAAVLVVIGAVWIGQGLGFFRGSGFMDGDPRWAVDRCGAGRASASSSAGPRSGCAGRRPDPARPGLLRRADGHLVPVPGEREPQEPRVGQQPGDDPGVVEAAGRRDRRPGTGARSCRGARPAPSRSVKRWSSPGAIGALLAGRRSGRRPVVRGRSEGPRASRPSRPARRPGCRASSWSASCRAGLAWRAG